MTLPVFVVISNFFPWDHSFAARKSGSLITTCAGQNLCLLQLGIPLHQLLQAEARKLYSNLDVFAFSFALVDGSLAVFGMANLLAGAKSALAGGRFSRWFWDCELLAARGEELGDIFDELVVLGRCGGLLAACRGAGAPPAYALVFVFVGVMSIGVMGGASPRWTAGSGRPHMICSGSSCAPS